MGEVYRARDTRLGRDVALKILPRALSGDPDRLARFEREARMLAALNHPNIATIHGVEEGDGITALVLELVPGDTLEEKIVRAPASRLPIAEVLAVAHQLADGLDAAHQQGIIHRDLKPANIKITPAGLVKILDFGLARLDTPDGNAVAGSDAVTAVRTLDGVILGTAAYMSPEQARGRPLDRRTDVWAFGCVLYEMLTGRRAFTGDTVLDTLSAIIEREPDWTVLRPDVPPSLANLLRRSLEKDVTRRLRDIGDARIEMDRAGDESETRSALKAAAPEPMAGRKPIRAWTLAATGAAVALVAGALMLVGRSRDFNAVEPPGPATNLVYTQLTTLDSATQPTVSPDGRMIAFVRGPHTNVPEYAVTSQIYVKLLPDGDPVQLTRDDTVKFAPRFSPDGSRVVYSTLGTSGFDTWVIPVLGGQEPRRFLANAEGVSWIGDRLLFSYLTGQGITMAVATATESRADERTVLVNDGVMDHFSSLSPDGQQLLLAEMGFAGWEPCRLAPFDGSSAGRKVGPQPAQCTGATWSPDGKWMYFSADTGIGFHIWRQAFPEGQPEQVTSGVTEEEGISFSADGRSFFTSIGTRQSALWVHDARGDRQVTSEAFAFKPAFSHDNRQLYYLVRTGLGTNIAYGTLWVLDLASGQRQRLLPEFQMEHFAVARDGNRVALVARTEQGPSGVWVATLDGSVAPRQLTTSRGVQVFFDAQGDAFFAAEEPDGTFVYRARAGGTAPEKAIAAPVLLLYGVSPDGQHAAAWMTGTLDGQPNAVGIYPLAGGAPTIVCTSCAYRSGYAGPQEVTWSPDGRILYIALVGGSAVFAIPVRAGEALPPFPPNGLRSIQDAGALPGAKPMAPGAVAGADPSVYAYTKVSAQGNVYRVSAR
jgi:Tol biopolymer transport system component